MPLAEEVDPTRAGGLTGWIASVIDAAGELGVGLLVALENLIPPIPSEIVLTMAGYLAGKSRVDIVLVVLAATAGSLLGALLLYQLGATLGEDRITRWLDRIPLVESDDLAKADRWFDRHGHWAVLFGRMVPVVRSLVSIPAGANRMPVKRFMVLTTLGSGIWNAIFVGSGYALGSRWRQVEKYSDYFDRTILVLLAVLVASWAVKRIRRRRAGRVNTPRD